MTKAAITTATDTTASIFVIAAAGFCDQPSYISVIPLEYVEPNCLPRSKFHGNYNRKQSNINECIR